MPAPDLNKMILLLLAAVLGGGGVSATLPMMAPSWYRPDPARGIELRDLRREVDALAEEFDEFLREGPRKVRANQERILLRLEAIVATLEDCRRSYESRQ